MKVIGLTGTIGAGKSTIKSLLLKRIDCYYVTLSDIIRAEVERRKGTLDRKTLQDMGNELRVKYGNHILAQLAVDYLPKEKKFIVIDGIRNPGEIEYLKKRFGNDFKLIAVDAPPRIRFERLNKLEGGKYPKSWDEFLSLDERDQGKDEPEYGQQVKKCIEKADFLIINDGDEKQLEEKLDSILNALS